MQDKGAKLYFKNLDILRFVAAFLVVFAHAYEGWCGWYSKPGFMTTNGDHQNFSFWGEHLDIGIKNGGFGVDVFFLISGFLITYILIQEKEAYGKINIPKFFIRRAFRIWPAYFLVIALTPWFLQLTDSPQPDYWPNILFYNNFHAIHLAGFQDPWQYPFAHLWSICVEEHFYLIWPFIIAFIPYKYLKKTFTILILVTIFSRVFFVVKGYPYLYLYLHTISRIDILVMGAFFALHYKEHGFTLKTSKLFRLALYVTFIVVYFLEPVYQYDTLFAASVKKYFYCGIVGFGMINFLFNPDPLFKVPFHKVFNYLGKISYGVYLFSNVLIPIIVKKFMYKWETQNMHLYFFLNVFLTILVSAIVYELLEKQLLKVKKRFEVIQTSRTA